jgi:ACT domain-containing protein
MEQLLFAKAEITGEEYKPHDPDIRKEYEELLSMGMDEGSAMATAVDKFNLHVTTITPEDDDKLKIAVADVKDAIQEMDIAFLYADTINMITEYCTDDYVLDKLHEIHSPQIFQEDVNVFANDRDDLLSDVVVLITKSEANMLSIKANVNHEKIVTINLKLEVKNTQMLDKIIRDLEKIDSVYDVKRGH